jgi:hypothetical protein
MTIVINEVTIDSGDGGYVRWRPRMVRLSVFEDLKTTLTTLGWMSAPLQYPFEVKEFFPEFAVYADDAVHINTLVMDNGDPGVMQEYELGGLLTRMYRMNFAFYAQDDETGIAVFSDLTDRYQGLTDSPYISLLNYNAVGDPPLITRMEVDSFQYVKASLDVAPYEHHLWFGELIVRDFIDGNRTEMPT